MRTFTRKHGDDSFLNARCSLINTFIVALFLWFNHTWYVVKHFYPFDRKKSRIYSIAIRYKVLTFCAYRIIVVLQWNRKKIAILIDNQDPFLKKMGKKTWQTNVESCRFIGMCVWAVCLVFITFTRKAVVRSMLSFPYTGHFSYSHRIHVLPIWKIQEKKHSRRRTRQQFTPDPIWLFLLFFLDSEHSNMPFNVEKMWIMCTVYRKF